jgi:NhaP-type Na+/H+ or K+/H+ antiporter
VILAAFPLAYSAIAGRIERSLISGPIVFTATGFILGANVLGVLRIHIDGEGLWLLAELTLAMVLFTDAANADFGVVRRNLGLPKRLLLKGLHLTIVLGFLFAAIVFRSLATLEMALLAAISAPTDAALGEPVVVARMIDRAAWCALLSAVLSLTVIRMLPVFLCLIGTRTNPLVRRIGRAPSIQTDAGAGAAG